MLPNSETLLCRYAYDPLDRLVDCTPSTQAAAQRFYMKDRVATEIQGTQQRSIMQHDDQVLAQKQLQASPIAQTSLLATDQQRSVLNVLDAIQPHPFAYTPYGHRPAENGLLSLPSFNGERPDPVTGWYLLGNGYRAFNPVLMRFNSPDSWSPFGAGGLNAYAYCVGDPVNRLDPTGHFNLIDAMFSIAGKLKPRKPSSHLRKNSLDGVYRKTDNLEDLPNGSASANQKQNLTILDTQNFPDSETLATTNMQTDVLPIFIKQRQQSIKTLLGKLATTTAPSDQNFLRTKINSLDKQLVHAEQQLNALNTTTLPSANRTIRENLTEK